ncbi:MAG TPA: response regulator [Kofleriaceae bacterium]|nr:response regulator [Kofleriaceae bacterium]
MLLKKIVVAEDDDAIAHLINMALGDAGFLCLRARNGTEAIAMCRMHAPDLLLLDVMMPDLDGLEVARRLKADVLLSRTPILMLTALHSVDSKVEGLESGADDYLVKPFDLRELSARAHALIRASRRERDRNPTTELPGSGAIEDHVEAIIKAGISAAVLHFDVRGFDRYADVVGYARAESLVAAIGALVLDSARAHGGGDGFVGHLGGVDFIAVINAELADALAGAVIAGFEENRTAWLGSAGDGGRRVDDRLAMTVAVAPTAGLGADGPGQVADRLAAAMRQAKQAEGSNYVIWRPEGA